MLSLLGVPVDKELQQFKVELKHALQQPQAVLRLQARPNMPPHRLGRLHLQNEQVSLRSQCRHMRLNLSFPQTRRSKSYHRLTSPLCQNNVQHSVPLSDVEGHLLLFMIFLLRKMVSYKCLTFPFVGRSRYAAEKNFKSVYNPPQLPNPGHY